MEDVEAVEVEIGEATLEVLFAEPKVGGSCNLGASLPQDLGCVGAFGSEKVNAGGTSLEAIEETLVGFTDSKTGAAALKTEDKTGSGADSKVGSAGVLFAPFETPPSEWPEPPKLGSRRSLAEFDAVSRGSASEVMPVSLTPSERLFFLNGFKNGIHASHSLKLQKSEPERKF